MPRDQQKRCQSAIDAHAAGQRDCTPREGATALFGTVMTEIAMAAAVHVVNDHTVAFGNTGDAAADGFDDTGILMPKRKSGRQYRGVRFLPAF